ncbi:glycosyltransferase [Polynucleobacter paneuropaeus]|nr:glycosyltransferase [Polynucleobacter paneuropaeus]
MVFQKDHGVPLVSIGMPVYNSENYIREALESLLSQTFVDFELIISDNSSTDKTLQICREYASRDARIICIAQDKNIGPTANFNYVLNNSRAKYFMWAASDDRWHHECLEKFVGVLKANKLYGLVFSSYIVKNLDNGLEVFKKIGKLSYAWKTINYLCFICRPHPSMIYGMYRKEVISKIRLDNFDFADVHFVSEVLLRSNIAIIDEPLYFAGTKGARLPYSLTGKTIERLRFLKEQYRMLGIYFSLPFRQILFFVSFLSMAYNKLKSGIADANSIKFF